ncbi:dihydrolipoyllysine-residue acetyltransferase [Marinobacter zhejiangensis]|uniref:Acetyltransferase component of pyruvate dehydrogenase complex n=1 Tax=Marinobacter zhejiangensis TaxID=488535 RepID=A0A1I4KSZ6_9GAMM|nr:dihydrolipoyllysine-residue acetyltransferase [Marinobacter zhejiangensis]SFL81885.1 pyruvate dehydrogenase E2 component (dihydrolipoamide acetyltransferase) [Marinobacter zhejiangensis]
MSEQDITVPDLGGADEVEIIEITVSVGDAVVEEDPILTVESDKATVELPAPMAGKITAITVKVGDKVREGDVVGRLDVAGGAVTEEPPAEPEPAAEEPAAEVPPAAAPAPAAGGSRQEVVTVPPLDGLVDIPVIEVNVSEGDTVEVDDPLVTVESDKATMEIPSPFAGKVGKILVSVGDKISEGDRLVEMTAVDGGDVAAESSQPASAAAPSAPQAPAPAPSAAAPAQTSNELPPAGAKVHAGPAVRKLARELGADLSRVKGSGPKGRIIKEDVQAYIKQHLQQAQSGGGVSGGTGTGIPGVKLPDFSQFGEIERESMSRMHIATARNMERSWLNVPHVTQFDDADITEMEAFRKSLKAEGDKRGVKMTPLPFMLKACARALADMPQFNVALDLDKQEIIRKRYIHIGVAVDTPAGLVVPVIRDVDKKGLWDLAREVIELAEKARDKKLKPAEMQGACFTITSLGGIGGTAFTPIVNAPEVAILGISKASMKPVWDGSAFQPRLMLPLSLSYDHRAVNGADGARFTNRLSELLGDIRQLLL